MGEAIAALKRGGATIVRANIPTEGWIGGPGTEMAMLNRNPESPDAARAGAAPDRLRLRAEARPQRLSARLAADAQPADADPDAGRHHRVQPGAMPTGRCASARTSFSPPRRRAAICRSSNTARPAPMDLRASRSAGARRLYGPAPARRGAVPRRRRRRDRRQGGLSERAGAGRLRRRRRHARTIRSASPSPAAPGANRPCCAWPTPSSRRRARVALRPASPFQAELVAKTSYVTGQLVELK